MINIDEPLNLAKEKWDVVAIGEALVDFISQDYVSSLMDAERFERCFGGSPGNVVINMANLGFKPIMISAVGDDYLGQYFLDSLSKQGVPLDGVEIIKDTNTTVVMVSKSKKNPEFIAIRGADKMLRPRESHLKLLDKSSLLHFTAWALSHPDIREASLRLILYGKKKKKIIGFDPNFRHSIWEKQHDGVRLMKEIMGYVDIIKPSEADAEFIFGNDSYEGYLEKFLGLGCKLVILTLGEKGLLASDGRKILRLPSFAKEVQDTTGAGDAFWSGFYGSLLRGNKVKEAIKHGSYTAAYKVKYIGGVCSLPNLKTLIETFEGEKNEGSIFKSTGKF
ncbi:fructokinase [Natronincola peptidivorans]|uniref:Fructokinase n=1 Tax=Natronincola peptidivorans TaxID=426128 RepID=A0A1I0A817_9FIRM|nr:PfkB family carbohydrate kinase [Natronincola peptidivorans]SES89381.1 fructokinase [Natronincola peptidivorans]